MLPAVILEMIGIVILAVAVPGISILLFFSSFLIGFVFLLVGILIVGKKRACKYTYIHTHICMYVHTHTHSSTYIHTHTHTRTHAYIHPSIHNYVYTFNTRISYFYGTGSGSVCIDI